MVTFTVSFNTSSLLSNNPCCTVRFRTLSNTSILIDKQIVIWLTLADYRVIIQFKVKHLRVFDVTLDMRFFFLVSLKAIECICTQEKYNAQSNEKASNKREKGKKRPGTESTTRVSKKVTFKKHCNLCEKHGGAYTTHNTNNLERRIGTSQILHYQETWKETQSHKELFHADEQEVGKVLEGNQKTGCLLKNMFQRQ
jgi:hypothetical protein